MKQFLTGLSIPQEYVCLPREGFERPVVVSLTTGQPKAFADVTACHVMVGYKPLVIGICFSREEFENLPGTRVCLNFTHDSFHPDSTWQNFATDRRCVARLAMRLLTTRQFGNRTVAFYQGEVGTHGFINPIHRFIDRQRRRMRRATAGNVSLEGNLYDQVRIAYAVPRTIALMTVGEGGNINIFPSDLHGSIGPGHYTSSLRAGGCANEQVERIRKIVVSYVAPSCYRDAYAMGKNHMRQLRPAPEFEIAPEGPSIVYNLPIPRDTLYYIELELLESFSAGIHRVHLYRKVNDQRLREGPSLAHIHQYYAQWRVDHGIPTNFLLR